MASQQTIWLEDDPIEGVRKHPYARCEECPLLMRPYVPDAPVEDAELIVIGEAPGYDEARRGIPFVGASGRLLAELVRRNGRNPAKVSRHNVVACHPPENMTPTPTAIACCLPRLLHEVTQQTCKTVAALGKTPSEALLPLSGHDAQMKISDRRGTWFRWGAAGIDWISTWHPAYTLRKQTEVPTLQADLGKAFKGPLREDVVKEPKVIYANTYEELVAICAKVPDGAWVGFDIETDQVHWYDRPGAPRDSIIAFGFAWQTNFGVAVHPDLLYDDEERVIPLLQQLYERVKIAAHNGKFDTVFVRTGINLHIRFDFDFDTMLAHYAFDETPGKQGLKGIAADEFGLPNYEEEIIAQYLNSRNDYYSKIPYDKLCLYMIWDVTVTLRLRELYEERLKATQRVVTEGSLYEWPFMNLYMPAQAMLAAVEMRGLKVDRPYLEAWRERMEAEREYYQKQFEDAIGRPINLNSAPQKQRLFYDELRLPDPGKMEARNRNAIKSRSTAAPAMAKVKEILKERNVKDPFIDNLLGLLGEYQRVQKMISSYANNILSYLSVDGTAHPSYKIHGTETGRLSAVDPPIQTIPRPDDRYGAVMRSAFIARPGHVFVITDYSQGELRAAAHLSGDPFLLKVYEEGRDLHSEVAVAMYGPHFTKRERVLTKMFNFSYLYGGNEHSFAEGAGLPLSIAVKFVRDYNAVMPRLAAWKLEQLEFAKRYGFIETIFGRRRRFPIISRETLEEIRKACVNMPVQSATSDLNLISGIRLADAGWNVAISVHDSVILEVPIERAEEAAAASVKTFIAVGEEFMPRVKWDADAEIGDRWCLTPAEHVKKYVTKDKLRNDNDELERLVKWLRGEPDAIGYVQEAIAETCTSRRGELLMKASKVLEVL